MPKSRVRPGSIPRAARPPQSPGIVLDPKLLADCKTIGQRTNSSTGDVINACIRATLTFAGLLNAAFPFAAAMQIPQAPPPSPEDVIADPAPDEAKADDEETTETAEERLAKNRAIARGEAPTDSERETPANGTPAVEPS